MRPIIIYVLLDPERSVPIKLKLLLSNKCSSSKRSAKVELKTLLNNNCSSSSSIQIEQNFFAKLWVKTKEVVHKSNRKFCEVTKVAVVEEKVYDRTENSAK